MLSWLQRRSDLRRRATELYGSIVAQSRAPEFFVWLEVPDTVAGRFEVLVVHLYLVQARLAADGEAGRELSRALAEAFVRDMDSSVREMGIGDMGVPHQVRRAADAYVRAFTAKPPPAAPRGGGLGDLGGMGGP